jgi:hypothetical protein
MKQCIPLFNLTAQRRSIGFKTVIWVVLVAFMHSIFLADAAPLCAQLIPQKSASASPVLSMPPQILSPTDPYQLSVLRSIRINPDQPFEIDFIIDGGDQAGVEREETTRLIRYFLAFLAIPEEDLWVNLSPYESDRVISQDLAKTELGRDLLMQDYLLKQFSASMTYPGHPFGEEFWKRCYQKAQDLYGTSQVPIQTFNKVWIVPDKAVVYQQGETAFISEARLRIMLDDDYQNLHRISKTTTSLAKERSHESSYISSAITREVILPEIEKEVNGGEHFARMRQIYYSLILAVWYKRYLKKNLVHQIYADQRRLEGIANQEADLAQHIYDQYLALFKKGVYDFIKEDEDPVTHSKIPRKYISGGFSVGDVKQWFDVRSLGGISESIVKGWTKLKRPFQWIRIRLQPLGNTTFLKNIPTDPETFDLASAPALTHSQVGKNKLTIFPGRKWLLGLLLVGIFSSFPVSPAMGLDQGLSRQIAVGTQTDKVLNIADHITPVQESYLSLLKDTVRLEDVTGLDGKINPITGKAYRIDKAYFQRNWNKIFESTTYSWPQETMVIAAQHRLGLAEDGDLGPATVAKLQQSSFIDQSASQSSHAKQRVPLHALNVGDPIAGDQRILMENLKNKVSLEDLFAMDGKKHPLTGKYLKIDRAYFRKNWNKIFEATTYSWPQETVVMAAQFKYQLSPDGDLGPETKKMLMSKDTPTSQAETAQPPQILIPPSSPGPQQPSADRSPSSVAQASQPVKKTWVEHARDLYQEYSNWILGVLTGTVIGMVVLRNLRNRQRSPFDKDPFLQDFSQWLKGSERSAFGNGAVLQEGLIGNGVRFSNLTAIRIGNKLELILRSDKALNGFRNGHNEQIVHAIEGIFQKKGMRVFVDAQKPVDLKLKTVKVNTTTIMLRLNIPVKDHIRIRGGDPVFIDYENSEGKRRTLSIPLANDTVQELVDRWEKMLDAKQIFEKKQDLHNEIASASFKKEEAQEVLRSLHSRYYRLKEEIHTNLGKEPPLESPVQLRMKMDVLLSEIQAAQRVRNAMERELNGLNNVMSLEELVEQINVFRSNNPYVFKDFRDKPAVINFQIRRMTKNTIKRIKQDTGVSQIYRDYFHYLSQSFNTARRMMGHSGTLDGYKDLFPPIRDALKIKIWGVDLDKLLRIAVLQEFAYNRVKKMIKRTIPQFYHEQKMVETMEAEILGDAFVPPAAYSIESLRKEFDQFNESLERPYADSITGPDLWRRHRKFISMAETVVVFFSTLFLLWKFDWITQSWAPLLIVVNYLLFQLVIPNMMINLTEREYHRYRRKINQYSGEVRPLQIFDSPVTSQGRFLTALTNRYLPPALQKSKVMLLDADRIYDLKAVRVNSDVELRLIADSYLSEREINLMMAKIQRDVYASEVLSASAGHVVRILINQQGAQTQILSKDMVFVSHPTGIRIRLKNIPIAVDQITMEFQDGAQASMLTANVSIKVDEFQKLMNEWEHLLEDPSHLTKEKVHELMEAIWTFRNPDKLKLADFRKNAGYFNRIRDYSLDTYVLIRDSGQKELTRYEDYFLALAEYANEVRFLVASFSGMDIRKGEYLPDKHKFLWKPFGISIATILRTMFGTTFLYSWATSDTLASISRLTAQAKDLDLREAALLERQSAGDETFRKVEKKLKAELESIDLKYRYPLRHGIVKGRDFYARGLAMWSKLFVAGLFMVSIVTFILPFVNYILGAVGLPVLALDGVYDVLRNSTVFGVSLALISLFYVIILYWITPYHAHMETAREKAFFDNLVEQYHSPQPLTGKELERLDKKHREYSYRWREYFDVGILLAGLKFPIIIPGVFIFQQVEFALHHRNHKKTNGLSSSADTQTQEVASHPPKRDSTASSPLRSHQFQTRGTPLDRNQVQNESDALGGIDLKFGADEFKVIDGKSPLPVSQPPVPEVLNTQTFNGFEFHIIQFLPATSPVQLFMGKVPETKENNPSAPISLELSSLPKS